MKIEGMWFNNGYMGYVVGNKLRVKTTKEVVDEDWKTALVHDIKPIPTGVELICEVYNNCYGTYLKTKYNGQTYYIEPRDCDYIDG